MDTRVTPSASPPIRGMETRRRELSPSIDRESQDQYILSDRQASDVYSSKTADRAPELYRDFARSISVSDSRSLSSVLDPDKPFQRSPQYHSNQQQDNQPLLSNREPERVSSTSNSAWMYSNERQPYHQPPPRHSNSLHHAKNIHIDINSQDMDPTFFDGQRSVPSAKRRVTKDKQSKGEREEVWPADVENAFMKALEVLPKLGRRKVLVNGKSCGRNELIADFILQQTQKVRDRKQVSSHIQVLKNTRKHDIAFMRLLMDSGDGDDDGAPEIFNPGRTSASHSPIPSFYLEQDRESQIRSEEWVKDNDFGLSETHIHELARAHELGPSQFRDVDVHQLSPEKFPGLYDLYENASCAFLYMKIGVNLNLHLDGNFDNTCIFDSNEQRPVRCLTLTYSFGAKVLESEEIKQASFVDGKITHSFEFVNQFFDAFFSGIKSLGTMEEVEVALCNLSLVQIYEDLEPRVEGGSPLLMMAFDFERGHGVITPHVISSRNA
ncbi:hypothetical protein BGZ46_004153 [Entomortierella lignicola]|nr:hypothetical protein BGZ46_004153 [Entomortierella lignicola]